MRSRLDAPRPLELILRRSALVENHGAAPHDKVRLLLDACSGSIPRRHWKKLSIHPEGRSLILALPESEWFERHGVVLTALRVKGVTDHGKAPSTKVYQKSQHSRFRPSARKLSIVDGVAQVASAPAQPTGYVLKDDASNEFVVARHAFRLSLPVPYPIALGTFLDRSFQGQPLGVVMYAVPELDNLRLIDATRYSIARPAITSACALLRRFHEAGICHWNPHHGNFYFSHDMEIGLCDFEDSRVVNLHGVSNQEFALYRCRDIRALPINLTKHHAYSLQGAPNNPLTFLEQTFMQGYFGGRNSGTHNIRQAISEAVADPDSMELASDDNHGRSLTNLLNRLYNRSALFAAIIDSL
ncbi:MAG: hypothetical protein K1X79_04030 [Oligoflexia bacterium]|nr:hypothetical protein [Oligoflexia bacterium]